MDFNSIYESAKNFLPLLLFFPILRVLFGGAIYVKFSIHKVLGIVYDSDRPEFKQIMDDQMELDLLRAMYPKFKFFSRSHAMDIIAWCQSLGLGADDVQKIFSRIRYDPAGMEKVKVSSVGALSDKWASIIIMIVCVIFVLVMLWLVTVSGMFGRVLVYTNESKIMLWLDKDAKFHRKSSSNKIIWSMEKDACLTKQKEYVGITEKEKKSLCEWVSSHDVPKEVEDTYIQAVIVSSILSLIFGIWGWVSYRDWTNLKTFDRVIARLKNADKLKDPLAPSDVVSTVA